jgi:hypothetical protein
MHTGIRSIDEPDWAPPGGTSSNRWREIREPLEVAFLAGLRERIAQLGDTAWIKEYNDGSSAHIGWTDARDGGYYVGFGLEHRSYLPPDRQRWFVWLQYRDERGADDRIGETWFEAPYARDTKLHLDVVMAWFEAHRRNVLGRGSLLGCGCPANIVADEGHQEGCSEASR